jgi:hypothetical protein
MGILLRTAGHVHILAVRAEKPESPVLAVEIAFVRKCARTEPDVPKVCFEEV